MSHIPLALDRLNLEVQSYQGKHQCLQVLYEIVEDAQAFRILRFGNIDEGPNLGCL